MAARAPLRSRAQFRKPNRSGVRKPNETVSRTLLTKPADGLKNDVHITATTTIVTATGAK